MSESGYLNKALLCIVWICIKPSLLRLLNCTSSSSYLSAILTLLTLFILCSNYCDFSLSILSYPVYSWLNKLYQSRKHNRSDLKTCWMTTLNTPVVYENNVLSFLFFSVLALLPGDLCITQWVHLTLDSLSVTRKLVKEFFFFLFSMYISLTLNSDACLYFPVYIFSL